MNENLIIPADKKITCKICYLTSKSGTGDMDANIHSGFTIGKGKTLYWLIRWHKSGHCTVYKKDESKGLIKRHLSGDSIITIHFK